MQFRLLQTAKDNRDLHHGVTNAPQRQHSQPAQQPISPRSRHFLRSFFRVLPRKMQQQPLPQRTQRPLPNLGQPARMLHQIQHP